MPIFEPGAVSAGAIDSIGDHRLGIMAMCSPISFYLLDQITAFMVSIPTERIDPGIALLQADTQLCFELYIDLVFAAPRWTRTIGRT